MSGKPITFGRYQKVEAILEGDRAIKAKLGTKTEIVCRPPPSNEKAFFSKPVVYITEMLHASGVDAHTTSKTDVLKAALRLLQDGDGQFKIPDHAVQSAPEPEPAAEPAPVPKKPKAEKLKPVVVPKPVDVPKPVVVAKPVVVKKVSSGVAKGYVIKKKAIESEEKAVAKAEPAKPVIERQSKTVTDPFFPYAYGVSLVTLLLAVDQIMEAHDKSPGRKERQEKVAALIRECRTLTIIPKSAKEISATHE